jgi:C-terminal processing protease CtpA/Prc
VLAIMEGNSINRLKIDWTAFRSDVFGVAGAAQQVSDLTPAIRRALQLIGDGHSSYRSALGTFVFVSTRSCGPTAPVTPVTVPSSIGYVRVTGFSGTPTEATEFSSNIQASIRAQDSEAIRGWIVDLRSNTGGNMWPMLSGIGPILGVDTVGFFINPVGAQVWWGYREDGASTSNGFVVHQSPIPHRLRREMPPVAVLTNIGTASSGEAVAIAFRKRARTRSFGQATCGLSTANSGFTLADGALLNLTVSVMADRTREPYGDRVVPDEVVEPLDQVGSRAVDWLLSQSPP